MIHVGPNIGAAIRLEIISTNCKYHLWEHTVPKIPGQCNKQIRLLQSLLHDTALLSNVVYATGGSKTASNTTKYWCYSVLHRKLVNGWRFFKLACLKIIKLDIWRKKLDAEANTGWMVVTMTNNAPTRFGENQKEERKVSMASWIYEENCIQPNWTYVNWNDQ